MREDFTEFIETALKKLCADELTIHRAVFLAEIGDVIGALSVIKEVEERNQYVAEYLRAKIYCPESGLTWKPWYCDYMPEFCEKLETRVILRKQLSSLFFPTFPLKILEKHELYNET